MSVFTEPGSSGRSLPDPEYRLVPSGNLRRRLLVSRFVQGGAYTAAAIAVAVLGLMIYLIAVRGASALNWSFFTSSLPADGGDGSVGGLGPAFLGTILLVALAILFAAPVGVMVAIYLHEFASPKTFQIVRGLVDVMNGLPTIVVGVFIFGLFVAHHGFSGWSGSLALAIVVLPLITRSSLEAISRVPPDLSEAAEALGVSRWRTISSVILPTAWGGIVTASILAMARAAGETAPLLFTTSLYPQTVQLNPLHGVASVPLVLYSLINSGYAPAVQKAWGAAFVLLMMILLTNLAARVMLRRSQRKRGL